MLTLIVRQTLKSGVAKTWKLRPAEEPQSFGSSRLANMISISPTSRGIQGLFEYRDGGWWYIDMDMGTSATKKISPLMRIENEARVEFEDCTLTLTPFAKEVDLFDKLQKVTPNTKERGQKLQLFIVRQGDKVLETKVLPLNKKFKPALSISKEKISCIQSDEWQKQTLGNLEVCQRTVSLEDVHHWAHLPMNQVVDEDSKKGVYIVLGAALLLVTLGIFSPKSQTVETVATPPRVAQKIIVKTEIKPKNRKVEEAKPQRQQVVVQEDVKPAGPPKAEMPTSGAGGGSRISKMMRTVAGGRISQLIGKVSAQGAKSANVVFATGTKAGSGPSGRALSALGPADKAGKDWSTDSQGSGVVISTAGRGGGKNASGMGGLAAGGTGSGGVGLIEEEGEITGGLDREVIAQYIKSKLGQILYCYERQLSANPDLFGKVAVKFTIASTGSVEQQLIGDTTLKNATVEGCILNKVATWKFPAPQGGTRVLVTYPFLFKSTN